MRLTRSTDEKHQLHGRPRPRATAVPGVADTPSARLRGTDPLAAERRFRESGGPEDNATYGCGCGLVFEAAVSTGVCCPACGTAQAW